MTILLFWPPAIEYVLPGIITLTHFMANKMMIMISMSLECNNYSELQYINNDGSLMNSEFLISQGHLGYRLEQYYHIYAYPTEFTEAMTTVILHNSEHHDG
jgi:hypothetical protein